MAAFPVSGESCLCLRRTGVTYSTHSPPPPDVDPLNRRVTKEATRVLPGEDGSGTAS